MTPRGLITALAAAMLALASPSTASASVRPAPALTSTTVPGFDISGTTTGVDWGRAVANGARFVFISVTEGTAYQYPNFAAWQAARTRPVSSWA